MLWTIVVVLVILWLLGELGGVTLPVLSGDRVHILLVLIVLVVLVEVLGGRR